MFKKTSDNMFPGSDLRPEKDPVEIGLMGLGILVLVVVVALQISFVAKSGDDTDFAKPAQAQKFVQPVDKIVNTSAPFASEDVTKEIHVVIEAEEASLHSLLINCEKLELELKESVKDDTGAIMLHKLVNKKLCDTISKVSLGTGLIVTPYH